MHSLHIKQLEKRFIGPQNDTIKVTSKNNSVNGVPTVFNLNVGYLSLQVIYDGDNAAMPPDVIVVNDDHFEPNIDQFQSLKKWQSNNSDMLWHLLKEVYDEYNFHSQVKLAKFENLQNEFEEFLAKSAENDACDIHVDGYKATLRIPLKVDVGSFPQNIQQSLEVGCCAYISIEYDISAVTKVTPKLHLSQPLATFLGNAGNLRIPCYAGATILTYMERIQALLKSSIEFVCERYEKRKSFMTDLTACFPRSVVEQSTVHFYQVSFLLSHEEFHVVIQVCLSEQFPLEPPCVLVHSVYDENAAPQPLKGVKFDPHLNAQTYAQIIKEALTAKIVRKRKSMSNTSA